MKFSRYITTLHSNGGQIIPKLIAAMGMSDDERRAMGEHVQEHGKITDGAIACGFRHYDAPARLAGADSEMTSGLTRLYVDGDWEWLGKPYVKVYPDMVAVLRRTPPSFPASALRFPFPVFEIALPAGCTQLQADGRAVTALLVAHPPRGTIHPFGAPAETVDALIAIGITPTEADGSFYAQYWQAHIDGGDTIADIAGKSQADTELIALIAGVAMVATSDPAYCEHDFSEKWQKRLQHKSRKIRERAKSKLRNQGQLLGFRMGANIALPLKVDACIRALAGNSDRPLTWGHLRRAHFGWRHTKGGWRLRPIRMARIRADLPLKPSRGYETPPSVDVGVT